MPKIYDFIGAPNPRRVRVFLAEKGINNVPFEQVNIATADNRKPEFLKINPMGGIPVLELDDGTHIAESVAICRYFETIKPEPALMGVDAKDKAVVEMWNRRMELEVFAPIANFVQHTHPAFITRIKQIPEFAEARRDYGLQRIEWLDSILAQRPFVAGDRYTIADITALVAIDVGINLGGLKLLDETHHVKRWHETVSSRPSAKA